MRIQIEDGSPNTNLKYETVDSAGFDLRANENVLLEPGEYKLVKTGIKMEIPRGFEGQIRPRSGLAFKYGITVLNSPGTIDADYRGEIGVLLINHGKELFKIQKGDRIAQMVLAAHARAPFEYVTDLTETDRGEGGFGSTGTK